MFLAIHPGPRVLITPVAGFVLEPGALQIVQVHNSEVRVLDTSRTPQPMTEKRYILPASPSYRCLDRFSILPDGRRQDLEDEDGLVPFWPVLQIILEDEKPAPAQPRWQKC